MKTLIIMAVMCGLAATVYGHGMMIQPASRNTAWRYGFDTTKNYNDNELFCGGFAVQWGTNGGKCGVCGDAYNSKNQAHIKGGKYFKKLVITGKYKEGQEIEAKIKLTASHKGYFTFNIGEVPTNRAVEETDLVHKLQLVGGGTRYYIHSAPPGTFKVKLLLPPGLTCERCVMQWVYRTANSWDCDEEGCGLGFGKQEHFINCADVSIAA